MTYINGKYYAKRRKEHPPKKNFGTTKEILQIALLLGMGIVCAFIAITLLAGVIIP